MTGLHAPPAPTSPDARADDVPERSLRNLARSVVTLAGRNLVLMVRNPATIAGSVVFPLIFFGALLLVTGRLLEFRGLEPVDHLTPAIVVQGMLFAAVSSCYYLLGDRHSRMLHRCRSLPIHRWTIPLARLVADAARAALTATVIVLAATVVGFRFATLAGPLLFVVVVVAMGVGIAAVFGRAGLAAGAGEGTVNLLMLAYLPLLMFSSAIAPIEAFPSWVQPAARWSPVTAAVDALRAAAAGTLGTAELVPVAGWAVGLTTIGVWSSVRALAKDAR